MAHGTPDWGVTAGQKTVYQLTDLAELAVRLGSIVTYDRRGDVIFLEDFEDGLHLWTPDWEGSEPTVDLSIVRARHGAFSARLGVGTEAGSYARIQTTLTLPVLGPWGIEWSFNLAVALPYIDLYVEVAMGAEFASFAIRWVRATYELQYRDSSSNWVTFATDVVLDYTYNTWYTMKLVIDPSVPAYVRLMLGTEVYLLTDLAPYVYASSIFPTLNVQLVAEGPAVSTGQMWVDDVIITQNEP
jgi:hypothetical protein